MLSAIFAITTAFSQKDSSFKATRNFIRRNNIRLNYLPAPKGFTRYYNCDSMLFLRGDFGDTIRIWTPGVEWAYNLSQFKEFIIKPEYGKTSFAKFIFDDGRIMVSSYHETIFIYRNDSLFEVNNITELPDEYGKLLSQKISGVIADSTFERKMRDIISVYDANSIFVPKLIFCKKMFSTGKKKVRLSKKVNFEGDEIFLEKVWIEDSKKCYLVRINNVDDGQKTTYAYAINEDMKFIWWQGCDKR